MKKIIFLVPAFNEEKNLKKVILDFKKFGKVLVINDASKDKTKTIAKKYSDHYLENKKNIGYDKSLQKGLIYLSKKNYNNVITVDADGQHNPLEIKDILKPIEDNEADVVIGSRFSGKTSKIPKYRIIGIKAINKLTSSSSENKLIDPLSGFRAYTKKVFKEILPADSGMGGSTEVLIKANQRKFRIVEIPILVNYEGDTSTHNPINQSFSLIFSTMKFISIERPLTFYGIPGIGLLILGLFFSIWTIQEFSITREIFLDLAMLSIGGILMGTILMVTAILLYTLVTVVRERK